MLSTLTHTFSTQGVVQLGKRNAITGAVAKLFDLGNAPKVALSLKTEVEELYESTSGQRGLLKRMEKSRSGEITLELHNFDKRTLEVLLRGTQTTIAADTIVGETMATGMIVGDIYRTANPFISGITVEDSTAVTPLVLVEGTDYQIDANAGLIRFINVTGFVQPFKVDYDSGAAKVSAMFTENQSEYALYFSGLNMADGATPVMVELYNVTFDPADNIDFISDSFNVFTLKGAMMVDNFKSASDPLLGQYGRIIEQG